MPHDQTIQIYRTTLANIPPPSLEQGELGVEMASQPPKLWVGVPTSIASAGMIQLNSSSVVGNTPPSGPLVGDLWFNTVTGTLMVWNGTEWEPLGGAGTTVTISDAPPENPEVGNLWFDSVDLQMYIYYEDATSTQWVPVVNQGGGGGDFLPLSGGVMNGPITLADDAEEPLEPVSLQQLDTALLEYPKFTVSTSAPLNPKPGDLWYNSATGLLMIWNGTNWQGASSIQLPLSIAEGGTGATTVAGAVNNLGGPWHTVASMPLPLAITQGGTGATTGGQALNNLVGVTGAATGYLQRSVLGVWSLGALTGNFLPINNPTYTGMLTGPVATLGSFLLTPSYPFLRFAMPFPGQAAVMMGDPGNETAAIAYNGSGIGGFAISLNALPAVPATGLVDTTWTRVGVRNSAAVLAIIGDQLSFASDTIVDAGPWVPTQRFFLNSVEGRIAVPTQITSTSTALNALWVGYGSPAVLGLAVGPAGWVTCGNNLTVNNNAMITGGASIGGNGVNYSSAPNWGAGNNAIAFGWVNGRIQMYVDATYQGAIANTGDLGLYLPLGGGTLSGNLAMTTCSSSGTAALDNVWINGVSGLTVTANTNVGGSVTAANLIATGNIQLTGGVLYMPTLGAPYYFQRDGATGNWNIVEGGAIIFQANPGGSAIIPSTLTVGAVNVTGALSAGALYSGWGVDAPGLSVFGQMQSFTWSMNPQWFLQWDNGSGNLSLYEPGGMGWQFNSNGSPWGQAGFYCLPGRRSVADSFDAWSDLRLKTAVEREVRGIELVRQLNPINFERIPPRLVRPAGYDGPMPVFSPPHREVGFNGQEVQEVFPDASSGGGHDPNTDENYLTVSPLAILAVAINAIKELDARLAALEQN